MKINQTTGTNLNGFESRAGGVQAPGAYKIGQILEATVLTNSRHGQVGLLLSNVSGNTQITASTNIALQQNAHLSLKVIQLQPQLLLKVLPFPGNTALQEAMKNMLPRQTSLASLLAELVHKSQSKEIASNLSTLKSAGNVLVAALPERNQMKQADGLKRAILQSGVFLESKLANSPVTGDIDLSTDLKALLLRYMSALYKNHKNTLPIEYAPLSVGMKQHGSEIPPPMKGRLPVSHPLVIYSESLSGQSSKLDKLALLKTIQGALARLGLLQVATVENMDDGHVLWQLEIPVRQGDSVETVSLTIEKEQRKTPEEDEQKANWAVNLSLDLPQLGPLQSRISMDKLGLSTTFWSESPKTLAVIEDRLSELRANFEQLGLETHMLNCRTGQQTTAGTPRSESPLIDYRA